MAEAVFFLEDFPETSEPFISFEACFFFFFWQDKKKKKKTNKKKNASGHIFVRFASSESASWFVSQECSATGARAKI